MKANTALNCPIGSTAIIAGQVVRSEEDGGPSGYGILRNIPIINWVTASGTDEINDEAYLILVYPEIVNPDKVKLTQKPIDLTKDTEKTAVGTLDPAINQVRKDEQKKWYLKMFTW